MASLRTTNIFLTALILGILWHKILTGATQNSGILRLEGGGPPAAARRTRAVCEQPESGRTPLEPSAATITVSGIFACLTRQGLSSPSRKRKSGATAGVWVP